MRWLCADLDDDVESALPAGPSLSLVRYVHRTLSRRALRVRRPAARGSQQHLPRRPGRGTPRRCVPTPPASSRLRPSLQHCIRMKPARDPDGGRGAGALVGRQIGYWGDAAH